VDEKSALTRVMQVASSQRGGRLLNSWPTSKPG